ncbi:MAG: sigma-54 dependent transcriptional regulator [Alphaproteobacteria bacterium]|nr:sigma-54 dependent transcriptional regulator [Alphaproteobacteria bacterium]
MAYGVLVIEDEITLARNIKRYLENHGFEVRTENAGNNGISAFTEFSPDLTLLDFNLPDISGIDVLDRLRALDAAARVIMMTGHGNEALAVDAMKRGAWDYLKKPLVLSELKLIIDKAVGQDRIDGTLSYYRERDAGISGIERLISGSPAMASLKADIERVLDVERRMTAGPPPTVLITGETGTGKELVARALHFDGPRQDHPFVELNCASIPAHLLESELFGYERGAFTDARERKLGLAEAADGGTLFLDEIGELDLAVQAKLLRLLEDRKVRRLGSVRDQEVDIRIIAATNRDLDALVREERFRSDLLFRLRVILLAIPPLRERGDDANMLAEYFLGHHGQRYGKTGLRLSPAARQAVATYDWPGNVRELANAIEQAVLLADRDDEVELSPLRGSRRADTPSDGDAVTALITQLPRDRLDVEEIERALIKRALDEADGNVSQASKLLGLSRDTLRYRIKRFGLEARR